MPSQIKVDEIKNVAGQYEIKTNTFKGQTTAGSIAVQSEGTATTNLQQGLAKAWINFDGTASGAAARGSLNLASMTDTSTGVYVCNLTNAFANTNDCAATSSASAATTGSDNRNISTTLTSASAIDSRVSNAASGAVLDTSINYVSAYGDLA
tara:strand:- start:484 stop:939 length:456 start_codon:yes stop_codon:yes gene_type:complete